MKERVIGKSEVKNAVIAMAYGDTGVGKTVSTLLTAPKPIYYLEIEPRRVEQTLGSKMKYFKENELIIARPECFADVMDFFVPEEAERLNKKGIKTVVVDSLSHLMNVILLGEIEEETARAKVFSKDRELVNLGRTDMAGYGAASSIMTKLCNRFRFFVDHDINVICLALLQDNPKWNKELYACPAFVGKSFNRDFPAYFDLIGMVLPRKQRSKTVYPPKITFVSPDNDFVAKWTGNNVAKASGLLDWSKIIKKAIKDAEEGEG